MGLSGLFAQLSTLSPDLELVSQISAPGVCLYLSFHSLSNGKLEVGVGDNVDNC